MSAKNSSTCSTLWPNSLWLATAEPLEAQPALSESIATDVLIIGAGYTGLSAALHMIDQVSDITVIDSAQPGWGCSGRNGGQVNPGWKPDVSQLRRLYSGRDFDQFIDTVDRSADLVFDLIERFQIDCCANRRGSIIAGKGWRSVQYLAEWGRFWQNYGSPVELLDAGSMADVVGHSQYDAGLLDHRGGTLQPLAYARGLARACLNHGVNLFGDTPALSVERHGVGWRIKTPTGIIGCKRLVIATNGYTDHIWQGLAQSVIPVASMITASKPLPDDISSRIIPQRQAVAEYAGVPAYYRIDESNRMVFGWRGTVSGEIDSLDTSHLKSKAIELYPELKSVEWEYDWAGYVGITSHQRPLLLKLGEQAYAGLGYNGRGITMATMMGKQLAKLLNNENTSLPLEPLRPVPFHRFYPLGVAVRIITGHLRDRMIRPIKKAE